MDEDRPLLAFALSLAAGILMILEGFVLSLASSIAGDLGSPAASDLLGGLAALGVLIGLLVVVFAALLYRSPEHHAVYGIVLLLLSLSSLLAGGGFFLGVLLGVIGGILAILFEYEEQPDPFADPDQSEFFGPTGAGRSARPGPARFCENCRSVLPVGAARCPSRETPVPALGPAGIPAGSGSGSGSVTARP
ncbi:MAG: DUF6114 domain-containing protein [Thermoplasmata archaeon]|nr:DUF6114 domain-containing protein [Thermoplasmata archaeon]